MKRKQTEIAVCGHPTKQEGDISAFGTPCHTKMPRNARGQFDYCLDCLADMAIRCAWCVNVIFIGDSVTLYMPGRPWVFPAHTVFYSETPLRVVGCQGMDCASTGADYAGLWLPNDEGKGYVHRTPSMYAIAAQKGVVGVVRQ